MIDVYSWPTPNGHKVHIMLEECGYQLGKDWQAHPVNIGQGDQFKAEFLKISPNNKIPALVDPHGPDGKPISLFESGAILVYLASKTGKFLPKSDFPWLRNWQNQGIDWADYPHLKAWFDQIAERPAVQRGVQVLADLRKPITDDKSREVLFGSTQYQKR